MRKLVLAALALCTMVLGAPAAHAAPQYVGHCVLVAVSDFTNQDGDTYTGVLAGAAVGYDDDPLSGGNPAAVSITCRVKVNGVTVCEETWMGTAVAAGADLCMFHASDEDVVTVCKQVVVNGHDFGEVCQDATTTEVPPQEVRDILDTVKVSFVDPIVCPFLAMLDGVVPDVPGVLEIESDGDVHLLGHAIYDCPPYDEEDSLALRLIVGHV